MPTDVEIEEQTYDYEENEVSDNPLSDSEYQDRYEQAKKRVDEIKEFYSHVVAYVCVNILVYVIDLLNNGQLDWAYWVTLGWGIGVVAHFFNVFGENLFLGRDWEARKIRQIMDESEKPKRRG